MKKMIIGWLILVGSVLPAFAKTMYTSDITAISVRKGNDIKFPVIATLKSGQEVSVLESAQGWTKIQLPDGKQGWLITSYLTDEKPGNTEASQSIQIEEMARQLDAAVKENESLKKENQALKIQIEDNIKQLRAADATGSDNPNESEEFRALKANFEKISAEAAKKDQKIKELEQKPADSKNYGVAYQYYFYFFLAGAGVLILGVMIGASSKRRRSSLL